MVDDSWSELEKKVLNDEASETEIAVYWSVKRCRELRALRDELQARRGQSLAINLSQSEIDFLDVSIIAITKEIGDLHQLLVKEYYV